MKMFYKSPTFYSNVFLFSRELNSKQGDRFQIYSLCQRLMQPWDCPTIIIHHSHVLVLRERVARQKIALATIRILSRRKLGHEAGWILLEATRGIRFESLDLFYAAKEVVLVLLGDMDKDISGERLVRMLIQLYNKFLAGETGVSAWEKAYIRDRVYNDIVLLGLVQDWKGRRSAAANQTLEVSW